MSIETILSLCSLAVGLVGFFAVLQAYRDSIKSADPDMELLQRFVQSAPIEHLTSIKLNKNASNPVSATVD